MRNSLMEFVDKAIAFVSCPPPSLISLAVTILSQIASNSVLELLASIMATVSLSGVPNSCLMMSLSLRVKVPLLELTRTGGVSTSRPSANS